MSSIYKGGLHKSGSSKLFLNVLNLQGWVKQVREQYFFKCPQFTKVGYTSQGAVNYFEMSSIYKGGLNKSGSSIFF